MSVNTGKHGAVESVRYLLHYAGDKLGDLRAYVEKWLKAVDEGDVSESIQHAVAVARCMGIATGLVTGDHWTDASLDTIALKIYDILKHVEAWYKEPDPKKKDEQFEEMKRNIFDCYFKELDDIVKVNGGHFSVKLTWLDFFFVGAIEVLEFYLGISVIDGKYSNLLRLAKKIWDMPEIKDYISKRESKNLKT